jgi:hypothetical protein
MTKTQAYIIIILLIVIALSGIVFVFQQRQEIVSSQPVAQVATTTIKTIENQSTTTPIESTKASETSKVVDTSALASAKLQCASAAREFNDQGTGLDGPSNYQSLYNRNTGTCYYKVFATGHMPISNNLSALLSLRDLDTNTLIASCVDSNPQNYSDGEWTCHDNLSNVQISLATFNKIVAERSGK